jgi:hypothetical protein
LVELFNIGIILLDGGGAPAMGANKALSCEEIDQALDRLDDASVVLTQFEIDIKIALQAAIARLGGSVSMIG